MVKENKDKSEQIEEVEDVEQTELELTAEQLEQLLAGNDNDKLPPFELSIEEYDLEEFQCGIKDSSYIAGVITSLLNVGVSESFVLDYLMTTKTIEHNLKTAEIQRDMNVEISKNAKAAQDKYEL